MSRGAAVFQELAVAIEADAAAADVAAEVLEDSAVKVEVLTI
jgi:hypothetical protein